MRMTAARYFGSNGETRRIDPGSPFPQYAKTGSVGILMRIADDEAGGETTTRADTAYLFAPRSQRYWSNPR
ncbi:MAG: hypothetical protein QOF50_1774 [Gaiellaceae bacterium]|nr:hypothetical protein [Gaiellaceae bacterium]